MEKNAVKSMFRGILRLNIRELYAEIDREIPLLHLPKQKQRHEGAVGLVKVK